MDKYKTCRYGFYEIYLQIRNNSVGARGHNLKEHKVWKKTIENNNESDFFVNNFHAI